MANDFPQYRKDIQGYLVKLRKDAPEVMAGFGKLHEAALKPGALDLKQKELIALGIGIASRCDGCIAMHVQASLAAGATHEEIVEAIGVAVMMGGGPCLMYATHAMEALEQFEAEEKS
jgi:AhpD family alkylhydroperoxidase